LSRHRKTQFSRTKAILVAAGALSVATAASATAATWTTGHPTAGLSAPANGTLPPAVTDALALPQAQAAAVAVAARQQTARQQTSVTLAQRTQEVRVAQTQFADAQWNAAHQRAAGRAAKQTAAAQVAVTAVPSPAAPQQRTAVTVGSPQQIAEAMLGSFGWSSSQFACLDPLWQHESGWSVSAYNESSGAAGIPQALPGSRMASAGPDWQTDAATQIRWGLGYIKDTYGSPCAAWDHEEATGWY
jgi:hypothetical protein